MSTNSSYYIWYGNNSITNNRIQLTELNIFDSTGKDLQTIPVARGTGDSVVRTRFTSRTINLKGGYTPSSYTNAEDTAQKMADEVNLIFSRDNQFFRTIPKSKVFWIDRANDVSKWTASSDLTALALDNANFQFGNSSIKGTVDVSNSSDNFAVLTGAITAMDITSLKNEANLEISLNISDTFYISSVEVRIGNDSSNYYSTTFSSNYQGGFINGVNLLSIPFDDLTETGTVTDNAIDYVYIKVNYSSSATDFDFSLNGIFFVKETWVRNYKCYRDGSIVYNPDYYIVDDMPNVFDCTLLNYTGYSESTHEVVLFNEAGITGSSLLKKVDLKGTLPPLLKNVFKLNSVTNLDDLRYSNLTTNQEIQWQNSWSVDDELIFDSSVPTVETNGEPQDFSGRIPENIIGANYINFNIITSDAVKITQKTGTDTQLKNSSFNYQGQKFLATSAGELTRFMVKLTGFNPSSTPVYIYSDSGGNPDTQLFSGSVPPYPNGEYFFYPGLTLTATSYWIIVRCFNYTLQGYSTYWYYNEGGNPYGNGNMRQATALPTGGAWGTNYSNDDAYFSATIQPTPSTDIDWTATYKPRYI